MAVKYRTTYARWGNSDRGADGQSVTTVAGDTMLCIWFHPYGNNVYFNWDDAAFPVAGGSGSFQYGCIRPAAGGHHIDAYCDNGGPNLLMALHLTGALPSVTGSGINSYNPGSGGVSVDITTVRGGMIGCMGLMGWYSDLWGYDVYWQGSETEVCSGGGAYNNGVALGGYEAAALGASTNASLGTAFSMGDPDIAYVMGVGIRPYRSGSGLSVMMKNWQGFLDELRQARIPPELLLRRYQEAVQI